jgi:hypothetical protein
MKILKKYLNKNKLEVFGQCFKKLQTNLKL